MQEQSENETAFSNELRVNRLHTQIVIFLGQLDVPFGFVGPPGKVVRIRARENKKRIREQPWTTKERA